jgi:hypothetical protein
MKVEVWYAVDKDGEQYFFTKKPERKPERCVEFDTNCWINSEYSDEIEFARNFNRTQISEKDRIRLNIPTISWEDEPIKIELDIQAMVISQ